MSKIVSILVAVDQQAFIDEYEASNPSLTPDSNNPRRFNIGGSKLLKRVKMIAVDIDVAGEQATANLEIKASSGDEIRWYETPLLPSAEYSILIKDILPNHSPSDASNWSDYMNGHGTNPPDYCVTKIQQVMKAYYSGGELAMFSGRTDYTVAQVKSNAPRNGKLYYNLDFQLIKIVNGLPTLVATYYYDPVIYVNQ